MSIDRAAHYENIKPHNPSTEDWYIPVDMEEGDYLIMDPACKINEKGTREKNDGNEVVEGGTDTPLVLDPNEVIEEDEETLFYAEEDWQDPEQMEVHKNLEPDLPFTMQTRQSDGTRPRKKYNPYGDDFIVDRIDLKKIVQEVVGLEEITVSQYHIPSYHIIAYLSIVFHILSYHIQIISYHIISYHIISNQIISYHNIS